MNEAVEEGAGGQHHGAGVEPASVAGHHAGDPAVRHDEVLDAAFDHLKIGRRADGGLHGGLIERPVGLGAGALDGRALGAVQEPELDAGGVGDAAHEAVEGIDLAHQVALAEPADGRIAGHFADGCEGVGDQGRPGPHTRGGSRRLAPGVAAAHYDHIEGLLGHGGDFYVRRGARVKSNRYG